MNMLTLREIAKQRGVSPRKYSKAELIRALQREEGNFDCFARAYAGYCDQADCRWREDCLVLSIRRGGDL